MGEESANSSIESSKGNNAAEVAATLYNNKLYILTMPPSSLPRHPREEAKPGTNKYKDIVCSGRIWLQHKASYYRGHVYSNRLLPCRGCTTVTLHARISRVAYTLLRNAPPRRGPSYD